MVEGQTSKFQSRSKNIQLWVWNASVVGIRPDYNSRGVTQYMFNRNVEEEQCIILERECLQIMKQLEKSASVC